MKKQKFIITVLTCLFFSNSFSQNVGIGTATPNANALLHIDLGASTSKGILFTGTNNAASTIPNLGAGSRLMYYPGKSAFRVGNVSGTQWDNLNVGFLSTATGSNTTASGQASTALGSGTTASGDNSTSMGSFTTAGFFASTAMGSGTLAGGQASTAMGINTQARGFYSTSMGEYTLAKGYASTVVGMFNDPVLIADETTVSATTPLFIIGNGINNTSRSNAMLVRKDGNIGIGTNNPGFLLNFPSSLGDKISLWGNSGNHYGFGITNNLLQIHSDILASDIGFGYGQSNSFAETMRIKGNGNVGIGTSSPVYKLDVSDRIRIRNGAGANTAGIYLNKADNTSERAFIGMKDDNYVGLYGIPLNNWGFVMNTSTGNVGIGNTSSNPQALLHVVRGLKTNGPLHPTAAAIFEGDQDSWIQLSNNNNREGGILSGNQQTAIRSGIIFGTDSSLQLRTGGNFTRVSIDKTGDATFSGDASIAGNASISGTANITGNTTISGQANITGNAVITGEVRRPSTGSANLVPICFGSVSAAGGILSGTGNFTVTPGISGEYQIVISGHTYTSSAYCSQVTVTTTTARRFVSHQAVSGKLFIYFQDPLDIIGGSDTPFHFIVYKP